MSPMDIAIQMLVFLPDTLLSGSGQSRRKGVHYLRLTRPCSL